MHTATNECLYYTPDEDTLLLVDALCAEKCTDAKVIVEIGSGSGYVSKVLRKMCTHAYVISTDINPHAIAETARITTEVNGDALRTSMIDGIRCSIDIAVFNPPYLPSETIKGLDWIDRSWAGGIDGAEVIYAFLDITADIPLRYIVVTCFNHPQKIVSKIGHNYNVSVVKQKKIMGEHLFVLKIAKK